jgi:hypothetical protein
VLQAYCASTEPERCSCCCRCMCASACCCIPKRLAECCEAAAGLCCCCWRCADWRPCAAALSSSELSSREALGVYRSCPPVVTARHAVWCHRFATRQGRCSDAWLSGAVVQIANQASPQAASMQMP